MKTLIITTDESCTHYLSDSGKYFTIEDTGEVWRNMGNGICKISAMAQSSDGWDKESVRDELSVSIKTTSGAEMNYRKLRDILIRDTEKSPARFSGLRKVTVSVDMTRVRRLSSYAESVQEEVQVEDMYYANKGGKVYHKGGCPKLKSDSDIVNYDLDDPNPMPACKVCVG